MNKQNRISFLFDILIPLAIIVIAYGLCFFIAYRTLRGSVSIFEYEGLNQQQIIEKTIADILFLQLPTFHFFGTVVTLYYKGIFKAFLAFALMPIGFLVGLIYFISQLVKRGVLTYKYLRQRSKDKNFYSSQENIPSEFNSISLNEYLAKNNLKIDDLED